MSFEGRTSLAPRFAHKWTGQNYSGTIPVRQMNASFRFIGNARQEIRNTYFSGMVRLCALVGGTNTAWAYSLEDPIGNVNQYGKWAFFDSNSTLSERWYVPYAIGFTAINYYTRTSFNHTTGNVNNKYTMMEW